MSGQDDNKFCDVILSHHPLFLCKDPHCELLFKSGKIHQLSGAAVFNTFPFKDASATMDEITEDMDVPQEFPKRNGITAFDGRVKATFKHNIDIGFSKLYQSINDIPDQKVVDILCSLL